MEFHISKDDVRGIYLTGARTEDGRKVTIQHVRTGRGLYGGEKTKNDVIEQEFKKSKDFRGFVENLIKQFDQGDNGTKEQLMPLLKSRNQPYTVDGIIRLIIKMRGELHHYIHQSSRTQGTPFNHADFKIMALIAQDLADQSVARQIEEIAKKKEQ